MSRRRLLLLFIAAIIAVITVLVARSALQPTQPAPTAAAAVTKTEVLVAKKDLPSGSFVSGSDVEWRIWPADAPQEGLLVKDKVSDSDYIGAVVRTGLRAGEPLTTGRILKNGDRGFLAAVLMPGMRAMTVKITAQSGVAGFVFPNDYVDVILTHEVQRDEDPLMKNRRASQTVLENVRVLALDQKTSDQDNAPKVAELATVEVTPKQAEKLALIAQMGNLSLVLRSIANAPEDSGQEAKKDTDSGLDPKLVEAVQRALPAPMPRTKQQSGVTWDSDVSSALPAPADTRTMEHKVQIYRGSEVTDMTFGGN